MLRLSRVEFWDLTPGEFRHAVEGYQEAQRDSIEINHTLLAWQTAHMINIWLPEGKKLTLDDLMGKEKKIVPVRKKSEISLSKKREQQKNIFDSLLKGGLKWQTGQPKTSE
jgi:hypothetical protein